MRQPGEGPAVLACAYMRRLILVSLVAAACGDNVEPEEGEGSGSGEPQQIVATCDEAQLDTLVAQLPNVMTAIKTPCGR